MVPFAEEPFAKLAPDVAAPPADPFAVPFAAMTPLVVGPFVGFADPLTPLAALFTAVVVVVVMVTPVRPSLLPKPVSKPDALTGDAGADTDSRGSEDLDGGGVRR